MELYSNNRAVIKKVNTGLVMKVFDFDILPG